MPNGTVTVAAVTFNLKTESTLLIPVSMARMPPLIISVTNMKPRMQRTGSTWGRYPSPNHSSMKLPPINHTIVATVTPRVTRTRADNVPRVPGILNHKSGTAVQILRPDLQAGSYAQALAKSRKLVPRYAVDELQALMRHTSLQTTMGYYADEDADDTAAAMWGAVSEQKKNKKAQAKAANRRS